MTKYGGVWSLLPQTTGRYFFVAPAAAYTVEGVAYEASNDNDGLSPERAKLTVNSAITAATASVNDVIVLLPGSHSVTTSIVVNKAGLTITGIPGSTPTPSDRGANGTANRSQITSTETAGMIFTVTAANVEIAWLHLAPITAGSGISVSSVANNAYIHNCTFDLGATANTATMGVTLPVGLTAANVGVVVRNCYFLARGSVGPGVRSAQTTHGLRIESSTFELRGVTGAWAKAVQHTLTASLGFSVRDCDFINPSLTTTVITVAIESAHTADASTTVYRCFFSEGTDAIAGAATGDISVAESFIAGSTGSIAVVN